VKLADDRETYPALCDERIVQETCGLLSGGDHDETSDWITSDALAAQLAADSLDIFWDELGIPKPPTSNTSESFWIQCSTLCQSVVHYSQQYAICPGTSDVSCYTLGEESYCDLDVRPQTLSSLVPGQRDMPNYGDRPFLDKVGKNGVAAKRSDMPPEIEYALWELVERVANLFRIYPSPRPEPLAEEADAPKGKKVHKMTARQRKLNKQKEEVAKAYIASVIRAFRAKRTKIQMDKWFGKRAFSDERSRKKVLHVLNSVNHMISNVEYVYPGPDCESDTFAYVFPEADNCRNQRDLQEEDCTKYRKKFVFYLCPLYFEESQEMIATLLHEGSHHATAFTDDVTFRGETAYGRSTCKDLARKSPGKALKNADNFCYYIYDTATKVQDVTLARKAAVAERCPVFADEPTPDSDLDCACRSDEICFSVKAGQREVSEHCPFSKTDSDGTYSETFFAAGCASCKCRPSLEIA